MSLGGFIAGITIAVLAGVVSRSTVLREDASLAAFYLVSLALGVLIVSIRGSSIDLLHVLFGTVLALGQRCVDPHCRNRNPLHDHTRGHLSPACRRVLLLAVPAFGQCRKLSDTPTVFFSPSWCCTDLRIPGAGHVDGGWHHAPARDQRAACSRVSMFRERFCSDLGVCCKPNRPACLLLREPAFRTSHHSLTSGAGYLLSMLLGPKGGIVWQLVPRPHLEA